MVKENDLKKLLGELKRGLEAIYGTRLKGLYLFGSYARQEQDDESDIDLLVILDAVKDYYSEVTGCGHLMAELSLQFGATVSLVFMPESNWLHGETPFLLNVRSEAIAA